MRFGTCIAAVAAILLRFPPDRYGFYPVCPIHSMTGLLCPGCGATRALAALLRGDIHQAWHLNSLAIALLPLGCVYGFAAARRAIRGQPAFVKPAPAIWMAISVSTAAFTIARNLP